MASFAKIFFVVSIENTGQSQKITDMDFPVLGMNRVTMNLEWVVKKLQ
jgi:hypothetical protein